MSFTVSEALEPAPHAAPPAARAWRVLDRGCKHEVTRVTLEHDVQP